MFKNVTSREWLGHLVLFFGIPLLGIGISISNNDWTWFSRFGSLMVSQSIFGLVFHQILLKTRENHSELQEILKGRELPETEDFSELQKETLSRLHNLDVEKNKILESVEFFFASINALFGTLIWGFGDLIGKL